MAVLKAGSRLRSNVCATEAMVVAAPVGDVVLTCGGTPMIALAETAAGGSPADDAADGTQLGKRYVNEAGDLEVLCTKPGDGSLGVDGTLLVIKEAKPLPSSD
jgi:N-methylhydantoinase B/oxoprolinase/acetone carboxylase alpha subunit